MVGFIADTRNEISDTIGTRIGDIAGNNSAKGIANVNNNNQRIIQTNKSYNEGFVRKRKLYNYTISNNNKYRIIHPFE